MHTVINYNLIQEILEWDIFLKIQQDEEFRLQQYDNTKYNKLEHS